MDALTLRNLEALSVGLKDQRAKIEQLETRINRIDNIISSISARLDFMDARIGVVFAKAMGSGATS